MRILVFTILLASAVLAEGTSSDSSSSSSSTCDDVNTGHYDKPLHIGAIFILLAASGFGVNLPLLFQGYNQSAIFRWALFVVRHLGTGVILATAIVHILFTAIHDFDNECLSGIAFKQTPAAIALAGVYIVFLIDYLGMRFNTKRTRELSEIASRGERDEQEARPTTSDYDGKLSDDGSETDSAYTTPEAAMRQLKWEILLLECGIVFHSVLIGVAVGSSTGDAFVPYLIAICFHQCLEGMGLGSRICLLRFQTWHKTKIALCSCFFTTCTSIGIAIGVGIHDSYAPNSRSSLLAIGILNSLSGGILLYGSLVEVIANDFFKSPEMTRAGKFKTTLGLSMLLLGSLLMSLIAKWA